MINAKMLGRIKEVAPYVTPAEALAKLAIVLTIVVPVPITALVLGGFWLDYYLLNTMPILTVLGIMVAERNILVNGQDKTSVASRAIGRRETMQWRDTACVEAIKRKDAQ